VLSSNQLTELPPEIGDLSNLKILTVRDNPLSGPIPMFLINSLQPFSFDFTNTGLCVPDEEKVLDWFKRAYENGKHYVYVVGEGLVEEDPSVLVQNLLEYAGCEGE
jgi:hypothetical protein